MIDQKLSKLVFGISLAVLLLLSIFTFSRLSAFKTYTEVVDHSNQVLNQIVGLRSGFKSLMANQRSYLVTKEPKYYEDFQAERDSLRSSVRIFKRLTQENKVQQLLINNLETDINERIQGLLVEVINDTSTAKYKFKQMDLIERNNDINDDFNETLNKMHKYELNQMHQKLKGKKFEEQFTPFLLLITSLLAIGIISYSFTIVLAQLKRQQQMQEQLKENIDKLNKSNQELEQYAYVASHDLQEPLRKIRTFSDMLVKKHTDGLSSEAKDIVSRIEKSSEKMTLLINDLLSLSRLLSTKKELKPVDLDEVINEVLHSFEDKIITENVTIDQVKMPVVIGNEGQLHQLFQNLISNSLKFKREGVKPVIKFRLNSISKWVEDLEIKYYQISVIDNGMGFSNEYRDKMFAIFGRLEKTNTIDGTGIGLSICHRIMENHNGEISAEGIPNKKAQFNLFFPIPPNE